MQSDNKCEEMAAFHDLLRFSVIGLELGATPPMIAECMPAAMKVVKEVVSAVGTNTHGAYLEISKNRYAHYFSAVMASLASSAFILDIGNAPGHVAIGCSLMGHRVKGVNLNAEWRSTYPQERWLVDFDVIEHNIEQAQLPFERDTFDAVLFTEVLEHVAITHPRIVANEIQRVLKPGGVLIFSTPNICNISNMYALLHGNNVFWPMDIFYGSLDRHNREYTPQEVRTLLKESGLNEVALWGLNDFSNWRTGSAEFATRFVTEYGDEHALCKNTIAGLFRKPI